MPKLISFDIGIRNLAYCIFDISFVSIIDWNVIDISLLDKKEKEIPIKCGCNCKKNAKYSMNPSLYFCEKHAKSSGFLFPLEKHNLKNMSVDSLGEFEKKWKIPVVEKKELKIEKIERIQKWIDTNVLTEISKNIKKKKESLDFIQIGRNMVFHLSKIPLDDIDYVIIENQISPIANKMRTIQGMVAQIFILRNVPTIEFVSSSNKLREYLGEKEEKKETVKESIQNPDYKKHKKDAIKICREWLEESCFSSWQPFFNEFPKKQDDLADSFLQGIWYLRKKMGISLEKKSRIP